MTIEYLYLFVSWVDSFFHLLSASFSFIIFFIHNNTISHPNAKMDKRFFKSWVLCIPHHLRDLLWIVRAWSPVSPIFSFSYYESSFFLCVLFPESAESNHFLLPHIPWMNESQDYGSPFMLVITTSTFSTSSSTASSCSLIWETLVKYDFMVSTFWVFTFFNWFCKVIF